MVIRKRTPSVKPGRQIGDRRTLVPVKMTAQERLRFKTACAEQGMSYAEFIIDILDKRDVARQRARNAQVHPLHQPATSTSVSFG